MSWISNLTRPRFKGLFSRRETPDNLWTKCPNCGDMVFHRDLKAALNVCPSCDHHLRLNAEERLDAILGETYETLPSPDVPADPLRFRDSKRYTDRLKDARQKTGKSDAFSVAVGTIEDVETVVAVQSFYFMGGSLGMAAGEALVGACETALDRKLPLVLFVASGGARMQEGILSLMQMPRTTAALQGLRSASLPYIVVFTDPTSGGVTASYAMLGDVQLAEPGALIAFSGPRVIEQTIRERLPEGFQRAEFLQDHGMVDEVVHRRDMAATLARIMRILLKKPPKTEATPALEDKSAESAPAETDVPSEAAAEEAPRDASP